MPETTLARMTERQRPENEAKIPAVSVGLKNDLAQLDLLAASYDFAVNEECFNFDECDVYADNFLAQGKPVFHIEYLDPSQASAICAVTEPLGLSTVIKSYDLDAAVTLCP